MLSLHWLRAAQRLTARKRYFFFFFKANVYKGKALFCWQYPHGSEPSSYTLKKARKQTEKRAKESNIYSSMKAIDYRQEIKK